MTDRIHLGSIPPRRSTRAKGYMPWAPRAEARSHAKRILDLYDEMRLAGALPMGPRQAAYRLKEAYPGDYVKEPEGKAKAQRTFKDVGEWVVSLQCCRSLPWEEVADASAVTLLPGGYVDVPDFLRSAHEDYSPDLRRGQPTVVEVYTEAKETLPLISRLAHERGVAVYSGSGSAGPNFAYWVARRALKRAVEHGQSTLILGICDFDPAGISGVLRPHVENLAAFLYGNQPRNDAVITHDGKTMRATDAMAWFEQIAVTPERARDMVETLNDQLAVDSYINSGSGLWSRDVGLLTGVRKVELEALHPAELRQLVTDAIDGAIDAMALNERQRAGQEDRDRLRDDLHGLATTWEEES